MDELVTSSPQHFTLTSSSMYVWCGEGPGFDPQSDHLYWFSLLFGHIICHITFLSFDDQKDNQSFSGSPFFWVGLGEILIFGEGGGAGRDIYLRYHTHTKDYY